MISLAALRVQRPLNECLSAQIIIPDRLQSQANFVDEFDDVGVKGIFAVVVSSETCLQSNLYMRCRHWSVSGYGAKFIV